MGDYKKEPVKRAPSPKKVRMVRKGIVIEIDKKELEAFKAANWQLIDVFK